MTNKWIDRMATPKRDPARVDNISELLMDTSKINMLRLLNRDEKYKRELAADFELLREWEEVLPLCKGSGAAALYEAETEWLGVKEMSLADRWRIGSERIGNTDFSPFRMPSDQIHLSSFVSEFAKNVSNSQGTLSQLTAQMVETVKSNNSKEFHLILKLSDTPFLRPNPYGAEQVLGRMICGEKCKKSEISMLLLQGVISLCRSLKNSQNLVLHLYAEEGYGSVFEAVAYLREHKLFSGELRIGIFLDSARSAYSELCRLYESLSREEPLGIRTELLLTVSDFADGLSERISALFRLYPRGGVTLGGVLTDSPAYFVADALALAAWESVDK